MSFCKETLPIWKAISATLKESTGLAAIGICLDPLKETHDYLIEHQIPFKVLVPVNKEAFSKKNKLFSVPQTIVRDRKGIVENVWRGKLSSESHKEVLSKI